MPGPASFGAGPRCAEARPCLTHCTVPAPALNAGRRGDAFHVCFLDIMPPQYPISRHALLSTLMASVVLVTACGGGQENEDDSSGTETTTETTTETAQAITATSNITWKQIASEWDYYTFQGRRFVRFGSGSKWVGKYVDAGVRWRCSVGFFGTDPAPGVTKVCQVPAPTPAAASSASLSWHKPVGSVRGYRVYWGTSSRRYEQARGSGNYVTSTTANVPSLTRGTKYYFAVTAIDSAGNESGYSNEASKVIP